MFPREPSHGSRARDEAAGLRCCPIGALERGRDSRRDDAKNDEIYRLLNSTYNTYIYISLRRSAAPFDIAQERQFKSCARSADTLKLQAPAAKKRSPQSEVVEPLGGLNPTVLSSGPD